MSELTPAQERAREKDTDEDERDDWLSCPECGSDDAALVSFSYDAHAACPECGASVVLYAE